MSTVKLSELTQATSINETDILILENTTQTQKATVSLLASKISSLFSLDNIKSRISSLETKFSSLSIPSKTSQLTNDSNYITSTEVDTKIAGVSSGGSVDLSNYYTKSEITQKINDSVLIPMVDQTSSASTSFTLKPNKLYRYGEKEVLDITLEAPSNSSYVNEYMCEFISGSTPTEFTYPDTVMFVQEVNIEANKTYQVSIINNIGVIGGVDNE